MNKRIAKLLRPGLPVYLIILFLSAAAAAVFKQYNLAGIEAAAGLITFLFAWLNSKKRRKEIVRLIQDTEDSLAITRQSESPLPKLLVDAESGDILWASELFIALLESREQLLGAKFYEILPAMNRDFLENTGNKNSEIKIGEKRYHIFLKTVDGEINGKARKISTLYFVDMTAYLELRDEYVRSRPVVSVLLIDNYDELTSNQTENDIAGLSMAIQKTVANWTSGKGGLLRKLERNRYLFLFESQYLKEMADKKFSLLEEIRSVSNSAGIQATVSIGIGKDGSDFEESYNFALLSIEMALSRGGDQVVVKDRYNFSFYSGRGKESGSRTKVRARVMAGSLLELIRQSSQVFIMGHTNTDLDALGAAAGIFAICRKCGKKARIVIDHTQNAVQHELGLLSALPEYRDCFLSGESALILADAGSLLVVVDTNRPDQVQYRPLLNSITKVAVIDHHRRAADYIENVVMNLHEPSASSACELVADLLQYALDPKDILPLELNAVLAGMVLDTKQFSIRTGSKTFEAAAFLERLGAKPSEVKRLLQSDFNTTVRRYEIVQKARIYRNEIALAVLDEPTDRVTAAQAADELINISDINASFVIFPRDERVMISARSIGEINVQLILEPLGGGGNPATAGAQIADSDLKSVVERLVISIDSYYEKMRTAPNRLQSDPKGDRT